MCIRDSSRTDGFGAHIKRRFILGNLALATENQEKMFRKAQRVRRLIVAELNKIYQDYDIILTPNGDVYKRQTLFSDQIKLSSKAKKEIRILVAAIEKARQSNLPLHEMFENLMNDIGYIEMLNKNLEENRIDNIHELQRSIYEFENQNPDLATIENYLQEIALYTDSDDNDDSQYVSLMTIHMAKMCIRDRC